MEKTLLFLTSPSATIPLDPMVAPLRKLLAGIVGIALAVSLFAGPVAQAGKVSAQGEETVQVGGSTLSVQSIQAAINAPTPNLANTTAYVFYTISVLMTGTFDPGYEGPSDSTTTSLPSQRYRAQYPGSVQVALKQNGLIGGVSYMMVEMVKNKPASGQAYVADLIQNSRLTGSPVYAQGIGFGALTPILGTWKAFRNVAYYLLTILFIVTGFLILIRHKISGNMAVTVQNALPRLVLTLVLITFSYAIAGLIVDLMYLSLYFIINIFENNIFNGEEFGLPLGDASLRDLAFDTNIFTFMLGYVFNARDTSAWNAASSLGDMMYQIINSLPVLSILPDEGFFADLFSGIISIIFTIIFGIALLIAMFRTFFALLMSYAGFVINVVMSPFILLSGAIPGQNPFPGWVKNLLGGLAPFVVAVFMIFMSLALTGSNTQQGIGYDPENPGESGLRLPLVMGSQIDSSAFIGILGMGFMLLLPEAVNMAKTLVGAKGGIFEQYKDKALANFKQGWDGAAGVSGKGIIKAGLRGTAGATLAAAGAGSSGYRQARAAGSSKLAALGAGLKTGAQGAAIGGAIMGPGIPLYNMGKKAYMGVKGYQETIDAGSLAIQEEIRQRNARKSQNTKAQNLDFPRPVGSGPMTPVSPAGGSPSGSSQGSRFGA